MIKSTTKKNINKAFRAFGLQVTRFEKNKTSYPSTLLEACIASLLTANDRINILQIGANDGAINDPIFRTTSSYPKRTSIILVEPQADVVPYLKMNYKMHPEAYIFPGAVGSSSNLTLYRLKKAYWQNIKASYGRSWPEYRHATGVTSACYNHVESWIRKNTRGINKISDAIEEITVECATVDELIKRAGLFSSLNLLQVDAEGADDDIIYGCNIAHLKPNIINYESKSLSQNRRNELEDHLKTMGYLVTTAGQDSIALRVGF